MKLTARDFEGAWQITREITDQTAHQTGTLTGTATFVPADGVMHYHEEGQLRFAGQAPLQAERSYIWCFHDDHVVVQHGDGAAFHSFAFGDAPAASPHLCGDDMYRGQYEFTDFPRWSVTWTVTGPRKNYQSVTQYRRF